ncbi:MAG TPA: DUF5916 domain-containing protein [Thermoanaerobaculia bacterium]|nr:DUF5916 domain-containing protein [Thermoanaerobaculia bacterium]
MKHVIAFLTALAAVSAFAAGPPIQISKAAGPITVDGSLSDPGWQGATRLDQWYETNPGDNLEPKVKSVGYLTYDDHFFYAGFEFTDPEPSKIRGPYNDRDHIGGNTDDYGGVILDTRNDGKTAILFLVNPRNIQYDAVSDDTSGNEDNSPDFFWDSATKITPTGWTLEIRIPFSTLRYSGAAPDWGIMLYRNWPRDRRYQMFANKLPRGMNCFICNESKLTGLHDLPPAGHLVTAPYLNTQSVGEARDGLGSPITTRPLKNEIGADVKWTPSRDTAIDATINPDFSQIESDSAVISTNERFAIFFPERRPFFLEGSELFNTTIQAVYTRTITSPRYGLRSTGKFGQNAYTVLVAEDRGGGVVVLPSALGSDFANQEFSSKVVVGRLRHDFGRSYASVLVTDREIGGGAHNRVFGPDFQWKNDHHTITGQLLLSDSRTPDRPELASEWNGQQLRSHASDLWYSFSSVKWDFFTEAKDFGDKFRADNGFIPQVGFKSNYAEVGRTIRPTTGFFNRMRFFAMSEYDSQQNGSQLYRLLSFGFGADGKMQSFNRFRYAYETVRAGDRLFQQHQLKFSNNLSVNNLISQVGWDGWIGQQIDFANIRLGRGASVNPFATIRPTNHLQLNFSGGVQWLKVRVANSENRLFTSQVERLRATYTFNSRMFLRTILQNQRTNRDQSLYTFAVNRHGGSFASQLLFAYKLNWQTVMYLGYGDLRGVTAEDATFEPLNRSVFLKVSYAFQR